MAGIGEEWTICHSNIAAEKLALRCFPTNSTTPDRLRVDHKAQFHGIVPKGPPVVRQKLTGSPHGVSGSWENTLGLISVTPTARPDRVLTPIWRTQHRASDLWGMATLAAAHAAADKLEADDSYGVPLRAWLAEMEAQAEDEWPRSPPKVENQKKLAAQLLQLRLAARQAALAYRKELHAAWELVRDERDAQAKAEYDAGRDWAAERAARTEKTKEREWRADLKELFRPEREKAAAVEHSRQWRRLADEQLVQQHARVRAPQPLREDIRQRRERQWAARRRPAPLESSDDSFEASDSDDPFAEGSAEQRAERRRERHLRRRLEADPPPPQSADDLIAAVAEELVEDLARELERQQRKADIITDGHTLYDEDFHLVDPTTRRHDDPRGAFVAYPDGARCWVHRPFNRSLDPNGGNAPPSLARVTAPSLLVMPWAIEHGFCERKLVDGVSEAAVAEARAHTRARARARMCTPTRTHVHARALHAHTRMCSHPCGQVCVLLRSLSKMLTLRGNSAGANSYASPADHWLKATMQLERCCDHDWCQVIQVPCSTDSPERVLVAVLDTYGCWSLSWLARRWRMCQHQGGIGAFIRDGRLTAPIRKPPALVPPARSLPELMAPSLLSSCRCSTRILQPDEVVKCGPIRLPPRQVSLILTLQVGDRWSQKTLHDITTRQQREDGDQRLEWRWGSCWPDKQATGKPVSARLLVASKQINNRENPHSWKPLPICACDASPDELRAVLQAEREYADVSHKAWMAKRAASRMAHERALAAAEARRANKRKLTETQLEAHMAAEEGVDESMEGVADGD